MRVRAAEFTRNSWRDDLKIHPRTHRYPLLNEQELLRLGKDIKKNGLRFPAKLGWYDGDWVLCDGRSRLDAMEVVGIDIDLNDPDTFKKLPKDTDPDAWIDSANLHRRHLSREWVEGYLAEDLQSAEDPQLKQDLLLAVALLNGFVVEDHQGRLRSKTLKKGNPDELHARQATARLLRRDGPLNCQLRTHLADLFDPPVGERRKIEIVNRRRGERPIDHVANTQIAQHIWDEMSGGKRYTDAINSAVDKFSISEDLAKKLDGRYRPLFEQIYGPLPGQAK